MHQEASKVFSIKSRGVIVTWTYLAFMNSREYR